MTAPHNLCCGLEYIITPGLEESLTDALHLNYSFIICSIVHPRFRREYVKGKSEISCFTRSDMILSPQDWTTRIVGRLSPYLNVDSSSPIVRQRHEDCLVEELNYSKGLGVSALMLKLKQNNNKNLSRIIRTYYETSYHSSLLWIRVPMTTKKIVCEDSDDNEENWTETWRWWSKFHESLEWDKRVGVVLEMSADLPPKSVLERWIGEPIKAVVIPTSIFNTNKKGFPILSRPHQEVIIDMVKHDAQVIISGAEKCNMEHYLQYVCRMWQRRPHFADEPMLCFAKGWEDYLQVPLQPLADNLDTHTYNIFEKDPYKYNAYQNAIVKALRAISNKNCLQNEKVITDNFIEEATYVNGLSNQETSEVKCLDPVHLMVLGAGRGPLVRAALNAAKIANTKIKITAVEKNPCAVVVLEAQVREMWHDQDVKVVTGDMRHIQLSTKADIIVSELLGSWGDNELSPECLDGASNLLKPDGISIPCRYSSHVAPISSPRLWAAARAATNISTKDKSKNLETLWVVYMQNKHDIAETKPVFTFEHPAKAIKDSQGDEITDHQGLPLTDNRRSTTISWKVSQDNVMHGFGGYFDCCLYDNEMISIVPSTHSSGMISWFPVFIPIKTPLRVHAGDVITATFWRCVDSRRVWYEWIVEVGDVTTPLHNPNGLCSEMLL